MGVRVLACLVGLCAWTGGALAENGPLSGESLRAAVAGKTVYLATPVGALPISYRPNGTMLGRSGRLAMYVGSELDYGTWWIARDRLCQRWDTWLEGKAYCYTMRREGDVVHWSRNDGRTGTATIAR
ncbi:MAG TPA: hypothetical protein VNK52_05550 [Hyphomicrobiaceae bacterium]|nr:hypothetical protein [Hyphomicrobiaceae bacterium]